MSDGQRYAVSITAVGEVRDSEGNLIEAVPVQATGEVTLDELADLLGRNLKE